MDQARIDRATNRIQAAMDRVEQAANRARNSDAPADAQETTLRGRVTAVLADLDTLIAGLEE